MSTTVSSISLHPLNPRRILDEKSPPYRPSKPCKAQVSPLQLRQHSLSSTNTNPLPLLLPHISQLPIINHHRPAPRAPARRKPPRARELGVGVAQEQDAVVLDARGLGPGGHDPGVVGGDHGDDVDALGLQVGEGGLVAGEVGDGAGGGEGAGDGEEDDFLVGPFCGRGG